MGRTKTEAAGANTAASDTTLVAGGVQPHCTPSQPAWASYRSEALGLPATGSAVVADAISRRSKRLGPFSWGALQAYDAACVVSDVLATLGDKFRRREEGGNE
jgi:hypothetical protein